MLYGNLYAHLSDQKCDRYKIVKVLSFCFGRILQNLKKCFINFSAKLLNTKIFCTVAKQVGKKKGKI